MEQLGGRAIRTWSVAAQSSRKRRVVEEAIPGFLKKAVAGHEAENSVERCLMGFGGDGKMFDRLRPACLDMIGNTEFCYCADCAAEGGANHNSGKVFGLC